MQCIGTAFAMVMMMMMMMMVMMMDELTFVLRLEGHITVKKESHNSGHVS